MCEEEVEMVVYLPVKLDKVGGHMEAGLRLFESVGGKIENSGVGEPL